MIYAMSDIHGCYAEFLEKLNMVDLSKDNKLVLLGDYMDYGPDSAKVLRAIYDLQREYGKEKVVVLMGNHATMFLE